MTAPQPNQPKREEGLLPCPFCGLPGRLHQWPVPEIGKKWEAWSVECSCEHYHDCPSGRHYLVGSAKAAAEAWNRRALDAATAELRRKVSEIGGQLNTEIAKAECFKQSCDRLRESNDRLRAELAALRAENERLKTANDDLRADLKDER